MTTGSLLVEIVDFDANKEKLTVLWTAYMAGLISGNNSFNMTLATNAIKQAFVQSPYIKAK